MEPTKPSSEPTGPEPNTSIPSASQVPMPPTDPAPTPSVDSISTPSAPQAAESFAPQASTPSTDGQTPVGPSAGGADNAPVVPSVVMPNATKSRGKRWLVPVIVGIVAVLVLGASYVFAFYLPNTPGAIYKTSLERTGQAVDKLIDYTNTAADKKYKSYDVNGTLRAKTSGGSFDATLKGSLDEEMNANLEFDADILGEKMGADIRSLHVDGNTSPDVYLRLTGIKSTLNSYGLTELDSLDNKWISIDHTIIDTMVASAGEEALADATSTPTNEQVMDAVAKVQVVNKDYLFTTDESKAVFKQSSYVGKETKDGRAVHHYKVGYDKNNLLAYVTAVGKALDDSKLNDWAKSAGDQKVSTAMDLESLKKDIRNSKGDYTFDMWIDAETKLVRTVSFVSTSDVDSELSLTQNYTGGDKYPFAIAVTGKDDNGVSSKMSVEFTVNTKTDKVDGDFNMESGASSGSLTFSITPSNKAVDVTAPTGAEPIMHILNEFGLNELY